MYNFKTVSKLDKFDWKKFVSQACPIQLIGDFDQFRIVVYGCGDMGRMCREFSLFEGIKIEFFIDKNFESVRMQEYWADVTINSISSLDQFNPSQVMVIVCVASFSLREVFQNLNELGFNNIVTFYDFAQVLSKNYPLNNGWHVDSRKIDLHRVKRTLNRLADKESFAQYLSFLAWRIDRTELLFEEFPLNTNNRFLFEKVITHYAKEHKLVDVGAHHGNVTLSLFIELRNRLKKVWCFEPDPTNFEILVSNLNSKNLITLTKNFYQSVVWNKDEFVKFSSGFNYASKVTEEGIRMRAITIDQLELDPTILKIHTEGSELEILRGAMVTVKKHRPIVMMTVYHNELGLFEIVEFISENLPRYDIYFRLHSYVGTGAVIYAIPKDN